MATAKPEYRVRDVTFAVRVCVGRDVDGGVERVSSHDGQEVRDDREEDGPGEQLLNIACRIAGTQHRVAQIVDRERVLKAVNSNDIPPSAHPDVFLGAIRYGVIDIRKLGARVMAGPRSSGTPASGLTQCS